MIESRVAGADELHSLLLEGVARARRLGKPVLVSRTEPVAVVDPIAAFNVARSLATDRSFWKGRDGLYLLAAGSAARMPAASPRYVALTWQEILEGAVHDGSEILGTGPLLLGGFPFDEASVPSPLWSRLLAASLSLPTWLLTSSNQGAWLTVNALIAETTDIETLARRLSRGAARLAQPGPAIFASNGEGRYVVDEASGEWLNLVERAKETISRGRAEKIVLARSIQVEVRDPDPARALARLRDRYPGCTLFAIARGRLCFLGASPERLVRLSDGVVQVSALAGTAPRGVTIEEDRQFGAELLCNAKDREEHAVVVRMVREALANCCRDLAVPPTPTLMKLRNVQHLYTPIAGWLLSDEGLLGLVDRLHPTPAVAGFPRAAAMQFLRDHEQLDRGLYAGPVGWVDRNGEGEFAVALRSALLQANEATLYAGCGIMVDSDGGREYEESCLKLQPMLSALNGAVASAYSEGEMPLGTFPANANGSR
ncbi:MAG: isochorismate synthase [Chloroflexota bacterium]|nr:isochorismate synthase [Chloroflexota bacterium]